KVPHVGKTDLSTTHPTLSAEWSSSNPLGPENYSAGSNKKVLWVCAKNHQYSCSVNNRTNGAGCPYCAGKKPYLGETDLATIRPDLLSEWDFSKNKKKPGDYTSGADQKVWWICQEGHSWMAKVRDRTRTDRSEERRVGKECRCRWGTKNEEQGANRKEMSPQEPRLERS